MFAMLVGTPPFETKSLGRTYAKIAANEYEIPERLSPSAKTFIAMLLNPEPKNRGHLHHSGRASPGMSVLTGPNWTGSDPDLGTSAVIRVIEQCCFNIVPDPFNGQTVNFISKPPKVMESRNYIENSNLEHY